MNGRDFNSQIFRPYDHIIMDCVSWNTHRFIDISSIDTALGFNQKRLPSALPWLYAFTCCEYISAFYRKGKGRSLRVVEKDTEGNLIMFSKNIYMAKKRGDVKGVNEARYTKLS